MSAWKWVISEGTGEKHLARSEYTPQYEKGIKKTQNKSMETTFSYIQLELSLKKENLELNVKKWKNTIKFPFLNKTRPD